jgi:hypothetical protein
MNAVLVSFISTLLDSFESRLALQAEILALRHRLNILQRKETIRGLSKRIIEPGDELRRTTGKIACRERLGGMLRYYHRRAA